MQYAIFRKKVSYSLEADCGALSETRRPCLLKISRNVFTVALAVVLVILTTSGNFIQASTKTIKSGFDAHSSGKPVPVGVPQGSILGPLLFLIYVNDLPSCLRECDLTLNVDDTVIYASAKDAATLESRLIIDLQSICEWFFDNLLNLNENTCKFVLSVVRRNLSLSRIFSLHQ